MKSLTRTSLWPLLAWIFLAAGVGAFWLAGQLVEPAVIGSLVIDWYNFLNNLYLAVGLPLNNSAASLNIPLLTALILGLVGALSPCQLSTGAAALAYFSPRAGEPRSFFSGVAAYLLGKVLVYSALGGIVVMVGFQVNESIPLIQTVRRALGPIMLLLGLHFLGVLRLPFSSLPSPSGWIEEHISVSGVRGSFLLGTAFALAFCPTLFLLFFGLLLPLALTHPLGALYPGLFALGTGIPMVALGIILLVGLDSLGSSVRRAKRLDWAIRGIAALVLLLAGFNDTILYWFL